MLPTDMKTGRHAIVAYRQVVRRHAFATYIIMNQEGKLVESREVGKQACTLYSIIVTNRQASCAEVTQSQEDIQP